MGSKEGMEYPSRNLMIINTLLVRNLGQPTHWTCSSRTFSNTGKEFNSLSSNWRWSQLPWVEPRGHQSHVLYKLHLREHVCAGWEQLYKNMNVIGKSTQVPPLPPTSLRVAQFECFQF